MFRHLKFSLLLFVVLGLSSLCTMSTYVPLLEEALNTSAPSVPDLSPQATSTPTFQTAGLLPGQSSKTYDVIQTVHLKNEGAGTASHIAFTVALISNIFPYQVVISTQITPGDYTIDTDRYENQYAKFDFYDLPPGDQIEIQISYVVAVNPLSYSLESCSGPMFDEYTNPERYLESDAYEIMSLARDLSQGKNNPCEQARAFYDYVGDEFIEWTYHSQDLGALYAAQNLSGDCTEFSDLFIALNRAADIPAQFLEGVVCCTENGYDPSENKHDWTEVYLPETGWVPADPTFGRSLDNRDKYFASIPADHIIVTRGRNLDALLGYHYYAYQFWWDESETNVSNDEEWSILER
jgi:transglutaminase-like putative cysteine protease